MLLDDDNIISRKNELFKYADLESVNNKLTIKYK